MKMKIKVKSIINDLNTNWKLGKNSLYRGLNERRILLR